MQCFSELLSGQFQTVRPALATINSPNLFHISILKELLLHTLLNLLRKPPSFGGLRLGKKSVVDQWSDPSHSG